MSETEVEEMAKTFYIKSSGTGQAMVKHGIGERRRV